MPRTAEQKTANFRHSTPALANKSQPHYIPLANWNERPDPMYVCNCNALTEKQVREAIAKRPRDAAAVYRYYDCQPQCGRCVCEVREMLKQARESRAAA